MVQIHPLHSEGDMMNIKESLQVPCEGIFWVIDGQLVALKDEVNPRDPMQMTDLLHKDSWNSLKDNYKVNGKTVPYDYFPRGRVETLVILNTDNSLHHYEASVYMDRCLGGIELRNMIEDEFRLYLPNVSVSYCGQLFIDGSHYTCYNCR